MTDVARLAMEVDSRPVDTARQSLGKLVPAARSANQEVDRFSDTVRRTRQPMDDWSHSVNRAAQSSRRFDVRGVSMQLSQVAQSAQVTGRPLQALAIQLPDIGLAFGTFGIFAGVAAGALLPFIANLRGSTRAIEQIRSALDDVGPAMNGLESSTSQLTELERAYELALSARGIAQQRVSDQAIQGMQREIEQRRTILEFERAQLTLQIAEMREQIDEAMAEFRADALGSLSDTPINPADDNFVVRQMLQRQLTAETQAYIEANRMVLLELQAQNAEIDMLEATLLDVNDALDGAAQSAGELGDGLTTAANVSLQSLIAEASALAEELGIGADEAVRVVQNLRQASAMGIMTGGVSGPDAAVTAVRNRFGAIPAQTENLFNTGRGRTRSRGGGGGGGGGGGATEVTAAMQMAEQAIRQAQRAAVEFSEVQAILDQRLADGSITVEEHAAAIEQLQEAFESFDGNEEFLTYLDSVANSLAAAIANGEDLGEAMRRVFNQIAQDLIASGLRGLFAQTFGSIGGGSGGFLGNVLGSVFGGFRSQGGPVMAGRAYMINEHTPDSEIFVPSTSGAVLNPAQAQQALGGSQRKTTHDVHLHGMPAGVTMDETIRIAENVAVRFIAGNNENLAEQQRRAR